MTDAPILGGDVGRSQIPHGVQDRFLGEALRRRRAEAALRSTFDRWGYQEVIPPTFEYYENLAVGASPRLRQAMYRFLDRSGNTMALRADFTPQVARIAATKLFDQPLPLRCCYIGSLFRYEEPQAGRKREFTQAGVELIGASTPAADAEVVALSIAALDALGIEGFQVNLGQMAYFRALTRHLPAEVREAVREAIDHKNRARLVAALGSAGISAELRAALLRLPDLVGRAEVLEEATALSGRLGREGEEAAAAVERLRQVYALLEGYGVAGRVIVDLSEVRGMDYYTGITFRGVAPRLGWPLVSGGRYDDLIARFGRPLAAVGFGLGIERALLIQPRRESDDVVQPQVLVHSCQRRACLALVQRLRQQGCRVELDVAAPGGADLEQTARRRGIRRTLRCADEGWLLTEEGRSRRVTEAELLRLAKGWPGGAEPLPGAPGEGRGT